MPNQPIANPSGVKVAAVGITFFKDLTGHVVYLSPGVPPGYPPNVPGGGFIGSRKRSWSEAKQQCTMYACSVNWKRVQKFNHFHFARLEGTTMDGSEKVYSWVSGLPDTDGGTGDFVVYSTLKYLAACNFRAI